MTALTYAGIGARATPSSVRADITVIAGWLARTRVPTTGWHLASGGAKGADTAFAAGAPAGQRTICLPWPRLQRPPRSGLPGALRVRAPCLHGNRRRSAPGLGPLFPQRPQVARPERGDPAFGGARSAGRCRGLLDGRGTCDRRHRDGHPHRPGPRHPGAQSRLDVAADGLRTIGRDPPGRLRVVEVESSACRASARQGWRESPPR